MYNVYNFRRHLILTWAYLERESRDTTKNPDILLITKQLADIISAIKKRQKKLDELLPLQYYVRDIKRAPAVLGQAVSSLVRIAGEEQHAKEEFNRKIASIFPEGDWRIPDENVKKWYEFYKKYYSDGGKSKFVFYDGQSSIGDDDYFA